jgi:hypothetical protein
MKSIKAKSGNGLVAKNRGAVNSFGMERTESFV